MDNGQIIFEGTVISDQDPLMLNRVRATFKHKNTSDVLTGQDKLMQTLGIGDYLSNPPTDVADKYKWGQYDPFLITPLLPFSISIVPKPNERIYILYYNKQYEYKNQYYLPVGVSDATAISYESSENSLAQAGLAAGVNYTLANPLKNIDGSFKNATTAGIFPEPADNALLGRGSTDMVLKEDQVILRAGKATITRGVQPVGNLQRSFIDMSYWASYNTPGAKVTQTNTSNVVSLVTKLIEVQLMNPENTQNSFTGGIYLYNLIPNSAVTTSNLTETSNIDQFKGAPIYYIQFAMKALKDVIILVNTFISGVNAGQINIAGYPIFTISNQFPFVFRLSNITYNLINTGTQVQITNVTNLRTGIKFAGATFWGKVYSSNSTVQPVQTKTTSFNSINTINTPRSYMTQGANEIFLISHDTTIPGTSKIDMTNTLYGIDQETLELIFKPSTNSMVRGEQLFQFLTTVIKFLINHVHPLPGLPPVGTGVDGTRALDILTMLSNAPQTILNQNIRIN